MVQRLDCDAWETIRTPSLIPGNGGLIYCLEMTGGDYGWREDGACSMVWWLDGLSCFLFLGVWGWNRTGDGVDGWRVVVTYYLSFFLNDSLFPSNTARRQ